VPNSVPPQAVSQPVQYISTSSSSYFQQPSYTGAWPGGGDKGECPSLRQVCKHWNSTKLSFHEKPQIFLWGGAIPPDPYPIWKGIPPHLIPRGLRLSPGHLATPMDVGYTIYYLRQLSKYDMKTNAPSTLYLS